MRINHERIKKWCKLPACILSCLSLTAHAEENTFRAGAVAIDISPTTFPRIIAGGFLEGRGDKLTSALHSRAIVLDDGKMQIAFAIVDTCMMEQKLIDEAKALASKQCGIPVDRMMVSATHTHSAPAAMGCLGTRQDPEYAKFLIPKIAESIVEAHKRLQPARIGWGAIDDWEHTHNRRWIRLPGKEVVDPFGNPTGRANMHPGYLSKDVVGPSGPVDPQLSVISIQTKDGKPLAVLANYSQHYFGQSPVSADYFGLFCDIIAKRIGGDDNFVCAMSQGTSGDQMWMDYGAEKKNITIQEYSEAVADYAMKALKSIKHQDEAPLGMVEKQLTLKYRTPDKERLTWAQRIAAQIQNDVPKDKTEVYAREAVILDQRKETTLKLQAIRIGDLSIATLPNEVYAITGLKLKEWSPFKAHFNIELANGAEGYIPPPEQHLLGGYTTWPARTAGLEVEAEPKIIAALQIAFRKIEPALQHLPLNSRAAYRSAIRLANPVAHWPLNGPIPTKEGEFQPFAGSSKLASAVLKPNTPSIDLVGVAALMLPGVGSGSGYGEDAELHGSPFSGWRINRAIHLAGGYLQQTIPKLGVEATIALWFWLGHESGASDRTGTLIDAFGASLNAHQFADHTVRLELGNVASTSVEAARAVPTKVETTFADDWHFVVLVRDGGQLRVHLDGGEKPVLEGKATEMTPKLIFGKGLQGKLDEITVWDRAIEPSLIASLWKVSRVGEDNARHARTRAERAQARDGEHARPRASIEAPSPQSPNKTGAAANPSQAARPKEAEPRGRDSERARAPVLPIASQPLSPEESLKKLHLREGFKAEIVAAEPVVLDPVAFDWDERGRLWVIEMADYPLGMDGKGKPGGRVVMLEDTNADGRYDKRTVVASDLNFPTGILCWRDGVIVTAAPDILFIEPAGDEASPAPAERRGVASTRVLFAGFSEGNQQLRVNGLRWGMDGWVYCAAGGHHANYNKGTSIVSRLTGEKADLGARDFRFNPDTGALDPQTGPSQFGRVRDDWDHWFGVQNSRPLWHYVLQDHYLRRNPNVIPPDPIKLMYKLNPPVHAASPPEKRFHSFDHATAYTSACGINIYRGGTLFDDGKMHAFTCEPFHNLVQHHVMEDDGVSFKAQTDTDGKASDFFASEDRWCRPVMVRDGPDGALYIADMYRYMIEHPQWLPQNGKDELLPFYREGDDRGRIYRITRSGVEAAPPPLLHRLVSPIGWQRDKAQMLIHWSQPKDIDAQLIAMARDGTSPQARAQAAWTLELLGRMTPAICQSLLADRNPRVREQALLIAEKHPSDAIIDAAAKLVNDDDAKVRLQLACTLGEWKSPKAGAALAALLKREATDATIIGAVMSSALPHLVALAKGTSGLAFDSLLSTALAAKDDAALEQMLGSLANDEGDALVRLQSFHGLLTSLQRRETSLTQFASAMRGEKLQKQVAGLELLFAKAEQRAQKHEGTAADRAMLMEIALLDDAHRQAGMKRLNEWLDSSDAMEQEAAITLLSRHAPKQSEAKLLSKWPNVTPALRNVLLDALMNASSDQLLASVKQGTIPANAFDALRQARLLNHPDKKVKALAAEVFTQTATSKRADVIAKFQSALTLKGDAARGKAAFATICIACHKLDGVGLELGPDLRSVVQHTPEKLLQSILDPSAVIEPSFMAYFCTLKSGEQLYGVVANETGGSITMKLPGNVVRPILRGDIATLKSASLSLMPDGLEATLTPQSLADLIAHLKTPASK